MKNKEYLENTNGLKPVLQVNIWKHAVNVYTDKNSLIQSLQKMQERDYGIPSFSVRNSEKDTDYKIFVTISDNSSIKWYSKAKTLVFKFKPEDVDYVDKEVAYKSLSLTERLRQLEGKILSNGAAAVNPKNEGVLVLGKRAHGKTSIVYLLCKNYDYSLTATDQVIFGFNERKFDENEKLWLYEGTKYMTLRRTMAKKYFPEFLDKFPKGDFWDDRIDISQSDIGIELSTKPAPIKTAVLVNVDSNENSPLKIKETFNDLESSLFIAEVLSRHITGICSPLFDRNESFLNICPSFDDNNTRKIREKLIKSLINTPLMKINGGDQLKISEYIHKNM